MRIMLPVLLILALPASASAQQTISAFDQTRPPLPVPELSLAAPDAGAPTALADQLLRAASGAAVGAWIGYMASQVAVGDWDDQSAIDRGSWTAGGAALGITLGLTIPAGRVPPRKASGARAADRRSGRNVLTREQIQQAQTGNLYQVIQSLRPEWLRTRGTGSMRETARGSADGLDDVEITVQAGIPAIRAYLDGSLLGDADELRSVDPGMIGEARFLSAAEATQRWGAGHIHGAILVLTAAVP